MNLTAALNAASRRERLPHCFLELTNVTPYLRAPPNNHASSARCGTPTRLVGVMRERFSWWAGNLRRPLLLDRAGKDHQAAIYLHARRGMTVKSAEAELTGLALRLAKVYPTQFPKKFTGMPALGYVAIIF